MDILSMTALELGRKIKAKEITVKEAVEACLKQIDKVEDKVNSFVTIDREKAFNRTFLVGGAEDAMDSGTWPGRSFRWVLGGRSGDGGALCTGI